MKQHYSHDRTWRSCAAVAVTLLATAMVLLPASRADALAIIDISPKSIQFGEQFYGAVSPEIVTVANEGDSPLTVSSVDFSGSGQNDFYAVTDCLDEKVPAGGSCEIAVFFVPQSDGTKFADLTITHNGQQTCPCEPVSLSGEPVLGYYVATATGSIAGLGAARTDLGGFGQPLNRPVVGLASTWTGEGVWLVAGDGGVFSFGDAQFYGSTGAIRLNQPVVAMAATPSGEGYWLVAADGGIFAFGDAPFYGSTGSIRLNQPVVGMAPTPTGEGYWLVAADGGIFAFGDAPFHGSTGSIRLNQPIVGMAATPTGNGYWFAAADGGLFAFAGAEYLGGLRYGPAVGMAASPTGHGYAIATSDKGVAFLGDSFYTDGPSTPAVSGPVVGVASAGLPAWLEVGGTVDTI